MINAYWENWTGAINPKANNGVSDPNYYIDDFRANTHIFYSFLTLAKTPNPDAPQAAYWDGIALYESMTQADVLEVMKFTDPAWKNDYNW